MKAFSPSDKKAASLPKKPISHLKESTKHGDVEQFQPQKMSKGRGYSQSRRSYRRWILMMST